MNKLLQQIADETEVGSPRKSHEGANRVYASRRVDALLGDNRCDVDAVLRRQNSDAKEN